MKHNKSPKHTQSTQETPNNRFKRAIAIGSVAATLLVGAAVSKHTIESNSSTRSDIAAGAEMLAQRFACTAITATPITEGPGSKGSLQFDRINYDRQPRTPYKISIDLQQSAEAQRVFSAHDNTYTLQKPHIEAVMLPEVVAPGQVITPYNTEPVVTLGLFEERKNGDEGPGVYSAVMAPRDEHKIGSKIEVYTTQEVVVVDDEAFSRTTGITPCAVLEKTGSGWQPTGEQPLIGASTTTATEPR